MSMREKDVLDNYDFTNRVIDKAVNYLETPLAHDKLGHFATKLLEVAYDSRALYPYLDDAHNNYFDLDGYAETNIIPISTMPVGLPFYNDMSKPTLSQYNIVKQMQSDTFGNSILRDAAPAYAEEYDCGDESSLASSGDAATFVSGRSGMIDDRHVRFNFRPFVVLNEALRHEHNLGHAACVFVHELSHATDYLEAPITTGSTEDENLRTELKAYTKQHIVQSDLLPNDQYHRSGNVANKVEQVRMRINGVSPFTEHAFDPNDEIKQALKFAALDSIYNKEPSDI